MDKFRISINKSPFKIKGIKPAAAGYDKYERSGVKLTANDFKTIMEEVPSPSPSWLQVTDSSIGIPEIGHPERKRANLSEFCRRGSQRRVERT